ncbi:MAG: phosphoesterase [Pirellulales bacterium]
MKGMPVLETPTEHVLVIPTSVFHGLGHFQGFSTEVSRYLDEIFKPEHTSYRPRPEMEADPTFKQLIPYVVFMHRDASGDLALFQYTRGKGQGEQRLRSKRSIGIGGHISSVDAGPAGSGDPYAEGMRRELEEEVTIDTPYKNQCVGLINDDESAVGRVHLGVVHLFEVERPSVHPREEDILDSGFQPISNLLARIDEFETWSQICLRALFTR